VNYTVIHLAKREPGPSDALKFCPISMKVAEGLILRLKRRLKTARLTNCPYRQYKINALARLGLRLGRDAHTLRHVAVSSSGQSSADTNAGFNVAYLKIAVLRLFLAAFREPPDFSPLLLP
jgi:hypothetical protein